MYERESLDSRIKRTRDMIHESLFFLMSKKDYDSIKIKDIAKKSGIARQTFYKHFKKKEEIVKDYIDSLFEKHFIELKSRIKIGNIGPLSGAKISFELWKREAQKMKLLIDSDLEILLLQPLSQYVDFILQYHIDEKFIIPPNSGIYPHLIDFITGGYYMMLINWIKNECQQSEETMAALISEILSSTKNHESYFSDDVCADLNFQIKTE
jgi:AcrR family transcriptional regulator